MMRWVRTTLTLDDELYRELKAQAARDGRTVGEVIQDAWRSRSRQERGGSLQPLPTYGGSGTLPGVDLADSAALREVMDGGEPLDALR
jgi:hypothetical protein